MTPDVLLRVSDLPRLDAEIKEAEAQVDYWRSEVNRRYARFHAAVSIAKDAGLEEAVAEAMRKRLDEK
jgi:hypothetical protein